MNSRLSLTDGMFASSRAAHRPSRVPAAGAKKRGLRPETKLQIFVVAQLRKSLPAHYVIHHSRNETNGEGMDIERMRGAQMGVLPGFPDLIIMGDGRAHLIEMKPTPAIGRRGKELARKPLRPNQIEAHDMLRAAGFEVATCYSLEEVFSHLLSQGVPLRMRVAA